MSPDNGEEAGMSDTDRDGRSTPPTPLSDPGLNVRQIAKIAGVSTATVSRVYRGLGSVSPKMRERVQAAIRDYNYRPSHFGEALARGRHGAIGIVFPGLSGPYFAELIRGFESVAVEHQMSVHILGTHWRHEAIDDLREMARRVDGIVLHGGTVGNDVMRQLAAIAPLVVVGADAGLVPVSVRTSHDAVRELVHHLLDDHGLRNLVFVGRADGSPDVTARWEAFVAAHLESGLEPPAAPLETGLAQVDGVMAVDAVLAGGYDGAVCANDETALGLMMAVLGRGLSVPGDLTITGIDDLQLSSLVRPGLTTVSRPIAELAATAARQLIDMIEHRVVPGETVLDTHVVRRGSCGCPEPEFPLDPIAVPRPNAQGGVAP